MPIVASRIREIQALLARLDGADEAAADSAAARLILAGRRALDPLIAFLPRATPPARARGLAVLEALGDRRALPLIAALIGDGDVDVARRAAEAAGAFADPLAARALAKALASPREAVRAAAASSLIRVHQAGIVEALDPLLDLVCDEDAEDGPRLLALEAVAAGRGVQSILERLRRSRSEAVAHQAASLLAADAAATPRAAGLKADLRWLIRGPAGDEKALIEGLAGHGLAAADALLQTLIAEHCAAALAARIGRALARFGPEVVERVIAALEATPRALPLGVLAGVLAERRSPASIPALHRALDRLAQPGAPDRPADVAEARARIHLALAAHDSRIALYDLRETLGAAPAHGLTELLAAAARVGAATLVPALCALAAADASARERCGAALRAIVAREGLRRNSRTLRAVRPEHRGQLIALWPRGR